MPHDGHDHDDHSELSPIALRVKALESLLIEKGYVDPAALDVLIDCMSAAVSPGANGLKPWALK